VPVLAPLFTIRPLEWQAPAAQSFDAVMLTSANAAREGGGGMTPYLALPCYGVGGATAAAAAEAGFADVREGPADSAALLAKMAGEGVGKALHLCGRDHRLPEESTVAVSSVPVYAAEAVDRLPPAADTALRAEALVLLHSPRAAALFAELAGDRCGTIQAAAISAATAEAAGAGWATLAVAPEPRDEALLELAVKLCQTGRSAKRRLGE
jgi:uroporphyrinogen-III synthase